MDEQGKLAPPRPTFDVILGLVPRICLAGGTIDVHDGSA